MMKYYYNGYIIERTQRIFSGNGCGLYQIRKSKTPESLCFQVSFPNLYPASKYADQRPFLTSIRECKDYIDAKGAQQ